MKKWAARLASVIILFDLIASLPITTFLGKSIDASEVILALALDIVTLILIASAWKAYK